MRDSGAKVVIYSWNLEPQLIQEAMRGAGASGYLSKVLAGSEVVAALERVMAGETVILTGDHETSVGGAGDWPGRSEGLSSREAEVPGADHPGSEQPRDRRSCVIFSINTVKTYIRSAYRKIDVTSPLAGSGLGVENGFKPDRLRSVDPALLRRRPPPGGRGRRDSVVVVAAQAVGEDPPGDRVDLPTFGHLARARGPGTPRRGRGSAGCTSPVIALCGNPGGVFVVEHGLQPPHSEGPLDWSTFTGP